VGIAADIAAEKIESASEVIRMKYPVAKEKMKIMFQVMKHLGRRFGHQMKEATLIAGQGAMKVGEAVGHGIENIACSGKTAEDTEISLS